MKSLIEDAEPLFYVVHKIMALHLLHHLRYRSLVRFYYCLDCCFDTYNSLFALRNAEAY